jgi:hypothetical protein
VHGSSLAATLSLVLLACGGGTQPGDSCDAKTPCSGDQICDMTDPGGPACLDGSGDLDNDGIANAKDFCEHVAGGAFDEDADGIGDECDACPIAKPPAAAETDGDGVDSPCDPNPTMPGDKIVLFNGFNDPLPSKWTMTGAWQVMGGTAVMTPTDPVTTGQISVPIAGSAHMAIFTAYRIDSVAAGATTADAAVVGLNNLPAVKSRLACGGSRSGTDQLLLTTDGGSGTKPFTNLFNPAGLYRVVEQIEGATVNCALVADDGTGAVQAPTSGNAMTEAGLFARGATARFSYLLVVAR